MSAYDKVKHLMIPFRPISPEQDAWIGATADLASAFSREVQGDHGPAQVIDSFFLQTAADLLWSDTGGKPCWSKLNIVRYLEHHARAGGEAQRVHAGITMLAFYTWMVNSRHLTYTEAHGPLVALEEQIGAEMREIGRLLGLGDYIPRHSKRHRRKNAKRWLN